jgi:acid phosphatase
MPNGNKVAVDSHPRLSGIMDTVNATLAHGPETKLPKEFYDEKARDIMDKVVVEEWFAGYVESKEFRTLGIGGLLGDIVGRMVGSVEQQTGTGAAGSLLKRTGQEDHSAKIRFGLSGCHDTTLAGVLASLGAYGMDRWPPFTSHVAIELFRESKIPPPAAEPAKKSWWTSLFAAAGVPTAIGRRPTTELTAAEKAKLDGYYVRIRYNDEPVTVPACKLPGNHLEGDESFCTLVSAPPPYDVASLVSWESLADVTLGRVQSCC